MSDRGYSKGYRKDRERRRTKDQKNSPGDSGKSTDASKPGNTSNVTDVAAPELVEKSPVEEETKETGTMGEATREKVCEVIKIDDSVAEKELLDNYIKDAGGRIKWKNDIRKLNTEATANRSDDDRHLYKLDSSLKKNTAFVRKCKTFSDGQKDQLLKEMNGLNLTKYIGELAQSLVECKLKMSDVSGMVEFCSAVHQRYGEFGPSLLENWTRVLSMKKEDKVQNPSKLRVDLRLYSELVAVGIFNLKESLSLLGNVLLTLVAQDKESLSNISIIISFCKHCGDDYAGLVPHSFLKLADKHGVTLPRASLLPPEKQKPLNKILRDYYGCLCTALVELHKDVHNLERGNRYQLLTRGEVSADRKERLDRLRAEKEKLLSNTQQMAESVGEAMIELPVMQSEKDEEEEAELAAEVTEDSLGNLWDDEDTKAFYESIPDLVAIIPSILYKDSKEEAEKQAPKEKPGLEDEDEEFVPDDEDVEEVNLEEDEDLQEAINLSNRMVFDAFLGQLPSCVNREMIDSAAAEFCMNHNTKVNRKRLVKALFSVHRTRTDLLPFYSRLVASLHPCMPDVAVQLCAALKQDFRWQVRKKDQINIESKMKVSRYIGELVKFNLFAKADALFCLKQLLFDFSHHHIEMACALIESCGAFLYRSADSHRRTKIYLEQMVRKKTALSLDARYVTMIENAYYTVSPPDTQVTVRKVRPPLHQFIRKLLYTDLNKSNCDKVLKLVRRFNWEDADLAAYIVKCIKNVWNIKYFNIRYLASLLAGLIQYHEWVGAVVTDDILEDIRMGMEVNNPKLNQRRTSMIKFLGELYNYRIIDSPLIFKVLYSLITFGVVLDHDAAEESLDPPHQMIRLRLVCVLLDTCGQYFSTGSSKKKLDYFLIYFQRYYWFKRSFPMYKDERKFPLGMSNLFQETLANLRPKMKQLKSFEDSCLAVQKAENDFLEVLRKKGYLADTPVPQTRDDGLNTINEAVEDEEEEEEELDRDQSQQSADLSHSQHSNNRSLSASQAAQADEWDDRDRSQDNDEIDPGEEEAGRSVEQGDEELLLPAAPLRHQCKEDEDFLSALDRMVNENITESKNIIRDKNSMNTISAPVSTSKTKKTWEQIQEEGGSVEEEAQVHVMVMLRKGGGGGKVSKGISVSADSELGEQFIAREEQEAREKARMKQLTLEISERQEEEELNEALHHLQRVTMGNRRGFKPQKGAPDADAIFGKKTSKF